MRDPYRTDARVRAALVREALSSSTRRSPLALSTMREHQPTGGDHA
jgi:hypothetical protein